jgi:hypothetical protein
MPPDASPSLAAAIETAHRVARERRACLAALRRAVESGDPAAVVDCARDLLGMKADDPESDRAPAREFDGTGGT